MPTIVVPPGGGVSGYERPALMALGDSLFNGVRAMSITAEMAEHSVPVMTARAVDLPFIGVNYPDDRELLLDVEEALRGALSVSALRQRVRDNARRWLPWARGGTLPTHRCVDNLGILSVNYDEANGTTAAAWLQRAVSALEAIVDGTADPLERVYEATITTNAAFILNPRHDPDLAGLSAVDQVVARKPRRLIIHLGNNDGVFAAAFTLTDLDRLKGEMAKIPGKAAALMARIAAVPEIEHIYFNLLVRPRWITNLVPANWIAEPPVNAGYFQRYRNNLDDSRSVPGSVVRELDEHVLRINEETVRRVTERLGAAAGRVVFNDLYTLSTQFDGKHYGSRVRGLEIAELGIALRNTPLRVSAFGGALDGGASSLDNMHLSVPGYALLANDIADAICDHEGLPGIPPKPGIGRPKQRIGYDWAFRADPVLASPPRDFLIKKILIKAAAGALFR